MRPIRKYRKSKKILGQKKSSNKKTPLNFQEFFRFKSLSLLILMYKSAKNLKQKKWAFSTIVKRILVTILMIALSSAIFI